MADLLNAIVGTEKSGDWMRFILMVLGALLPTIARSQEIFVGRLSWPGVGTDFAIALGCAPREVPVPRNLSFYLVPSLVLMASCGGQEFGGVGNQIEPDQLPDSAADTDENPDENPDANPDTDQDTGADSDTGTEFSAYDDFHEDQIIWLHTDVSGWDVTSTVSGAHINYGELCVFHTMAGKWPKVYGIFPAEPEAPMEGNIWIVARVAGHWYAATFDYLRPGGECKYDGYSPDDEGPGPSTFGAEPLASWVPRSGEPVYMFVSTVARHEPLGPLNERSNFVRLNWP